MTTFSILITSPPFDSQSQYTAYRFCLAAIDAGHTIKQVFFYQSAVTVANELVSGHSDDLNIQEKWVTLHQDHAIPLNVCITAANRRGIIDEEDAKNRGGISNLNRHFSSVGLGELLSLSDTSDRLVQF